MGGDEGGGGGVAGVVVCHQGVSAWLEVLDRCLCVACSMVGQCRDSLFTVPSECVCVTACVTVSV